MNSNKIFLAACKQLGYNPKTILPVVKNCLPAHRKALIAETKLYVIIEAANKKHVFNFNDYNEYKYFPVFDLEVSKSNPSGFRFRCSGYNYTYCNAGGVRLLYVSAKLCEETVRNCIDLYRDMVCYPAKRNKKVVR